MYLKPAVALACLSALAHGWMVTVYDAEDCAAVEGDGAGSVYRIYEGDNSGDCIDMSLINTLPKDVTCSEYHNGGYEGPLGCDGTFAAHSMVIKPKTQVEGAELEYDVSLYNSAGCTDSQQAEVNKCINNYGDGVISFRMTISATQPGRMFRA